MLKKIGNFAVFTIIRVILGHSGPLGSTKKSPETSTNTNRTKLNLCELNTVDNTLKVKYKFGAWQIL